MNLFRAGVISLQLGRAWSSGAGQGMDKTARENNTTERQRKRRDDKEWKK